MTATLNARAAGLWRNAEGLPVTVVARNRRAATVELSAAYGGYKAGAHVALPQSWVTEDALAKTTACAPSIGQLSSHVMRSRATAGRPGHESRQRHAHREDR